ncbi:uncharacterized protein LOC131946781 [Physella acuta]|uniref:uncharacterized protein LOC131946781 n=1 Tax=Physella acuta TaxID=109671 RepID=UPI0027DCDFEB|nr:uncharacterized protein LOC131946781 [Physella acuta]
MTSKGKKCKTKQQSVGILLSNLYKKPAATIAIDLNKVLQQLKLTETSVKHIVVPDNQGLVELIFRNQASETVAFDHFKNLQKLENIPEMMNLIDDPKNLMVERIPTDCHIKRMKRTVFLIVGNKLSVLDEFEEEATCLQSPEPTAQQPPVKKEKGKSPPLPEPTVQQPPVKKAKGKSPPLPEPTVQQPPVKKEKGKSPPLPEPTVQQPPVKKEKGKSPPLPEPTVQQPPVKKAEGKSPPLPEPTVQQPPVKKEKGKSPPLPEPTVQQPPVKKAEGKSPPLPEPTVQQPPVKKAEGKSPPLPEPTVQQPPVKKEKGKSPPLPEPTVQQPPVKKEKGKSPPLPEPTVQQPPVKKEKGKSPPLPEPTVQQPPVKKEKGKSPPLPEPTVQQPPVKKEKGKSPPLPEPTVQQPPVKKEKGKSPPLPEPTVQQPPVKKEKGKSPPLPEPTVQQPPVKKEKGKSPPLPEPTVQQPPVKKEKGKSPPIIEPKTEPTTSEQPTTAAGEVDDGKPKTKTTSTIAVNPCNCPETITYVVGSLVGSESRHVEFKMGGHIGNETEFGQLIGKYVTGFLNSGGGILFFGVDDNGIVVGLRLRYKQTLHLSRKIKSVIRDIKPYVRAEEYSINFANVSDKEGKVKLNKRVLELCVKPRDPAPAERMYSYLGIKYVRMTSSTRTIRDPQALDIALG